MGRGAHSWEGHLVSFLARPVLQGWWGMVLGASEALGHFVFPSMPLVQMLEWPSIELCGPGCQRASLGLTFLLVYQN